MRAVDAYGKHAVEAFEVRRGFWGGIKRVNVNILYDGPATPTLRMLRGSDNVSYIRLEEYFGKGPRYTYLEDFLKK